MSEATRAILTNREVIAVDQDPLGIQGFKHSAAGELEIWFKPLEGGDWAMCVLNRGASPRPIELVWQDEDVQDKLSDRQALFKARLYRIHDLWTGDDLGTTRRPMKAEIAGHDVLMVRLVRVLDAND
jgi:alpha-galactosidase